MQRSNDRAGADPDDHVDIDARRLERFQHPMWANPREPPAPSTSRSPVARGHAHQRCGMGRIGCGVVDGRHGASRQHTDRQHDEEFGCGT